MPHPNTPYARQILALGEPEAPEEENRVKSFEGTSLDALGRPSKPLTTEKVKGEASKKQKDIILANGFGPGMVKKPHIDALLHRGYNTIYNELERLYLKSVHDEGGLTATETKQFAEYIKTLKMMASEEREQRKADRIEDLTEDELRKLAAAIIEEGSDEL